MSPHERIREGTASVNKKIIDEREKTSVKDISRGLESETQLTVGADMDQKIQDIKTKIIVGKEPIEAWDRFVEQLKADPDFRKMTEEINESYRKRMSMN